jgi:hypothetical protein
MRERDPARQAAGERRLYAQRGARGAGPEMEAAEPRRWRTSVSPAGNFPYGRGRRAVNEIIPYG